LAYPLPEHKFILDTDCSDLATGAVLSQEKDGKERVIAYMSEALNKHEQSYCVTRKELLAVVVALKNFHSYLYWQEVLLRTDNSAVSWLRSLKTPTGQVARWLREVSTYNLEVIHRAGKSHNNADALSKRPCSVCSRQQQIENDNIKAEHDTEIKDDDKAKDTEVKIDMTYDDEQNNETETIKEIRAITRSNTRDEETQELTHNDILLDDWNNTDIQQNQHVDQVIGLLLSAKLSNLERPNWPMVSQKNAHLKTL
jgi:hypothetical protein